MSKKETFEVRNETLESLGIDLIGVTEIDGKGTFTLDFIQYNKRDHPIGSITFVSTRAVGLEDLYF